jgi:hypothetical protein
MIVRYCMAFSCSAERARNLCEDYLKARGGIIMQHAALGIRARGPLAFLSCDPRLYSHRNPVGLNPLALVDKLEGQLQDSEDGARLTLKLVSLRAWYFPALMGLVSIPLSRSSVPILAWGFVAAVLIANFLLATWLLRVGLRHELQSHIEHSVSSGK